MFQCHKCQASLELTDITCPQCGAYQHTLAAKKNYADRNPDRLTCHSIASQLDTPAIKNPAPSPLYIAMYILLVCCIVYLFAAAQPFFLLGYALLAASTIMIYGIIRHRRAAAPMQPMQDYLVQPSFPQRDIASAGIYEEMERLRRCGFDPVPKKLPRRKLLASILFAVSLYLLLELLYINPNLALVLLSAMVWLYVHIMTARPSDLLYRSAKRQANQPFSAIVTKGTYDEKETPKRVRTSILCALLILAAASLFVSVHWTEHYNTKEVPGGCSIVFYHPSLRPSSVVTIPETIDNKPVVAISRNAFSGHRSLEQVKTDAPLTQIGAGAFKNCKNLSSVDLPKSLLSVEAHAFKGCSSLKEVVIPDGVTEIRESTFEDCADLETITMHDGIVDIHTRAFYHCSSLTELRLPKQLTRISASCFEYCSSLEDITFPEGITRIAAHAFYGCSSLEVVSFPETVTEIGSSAFRMCKKLWLAFVPEHTLVNERAFKESPTFIASTKDLEIANAEWSQLPSLYYITYKSDDGQSDFYDYEADTILVRDDVFPWGSLPQKSYSTEEMKQQLLLAKEQGFAAVAWIHSSNHLSSLCGSMVTRTDLFSIEEFLSHIDPSVDTVQTEE